MELLEKIAAGLAADPEVQKLIIDLIMYGLAACGIGGVWLVKIRALITRAVPLLVVKNIAAMIDERKRNGIGHVQVVGLEANPLVTDVLTEITDYLPATARGIPIIKGIVSGYVQSQALQTLKRIHAGDSPLRAAGAVTRKGMKGFADFRADTKSIMGEGGVTFGDGALGGDNFEMRVGANVKYDWRSGAVDWGASLKINFG